MISVAAFPALCSLFDTVQSEEKLVKIKVVRTLQRIPHFKNQFLEDKSEHVSKTTRPFLYKWY